MGIQIQGYSGVVADVGGTTFRGLKTHTMPLEYGANGHYRKSLISGTMAAGLAQASDIWQLRWTDATRLCIIHQIAIEGLGAGTGFTNGIAVWYIVIARAWTTAGSGGTAGTLTGNNGKMRTSMGTTLMGDVRISSTAALTTGTYTQGDPAIGAYQSSVGATGNLQYFGTYLLHGYQGATGADGAHPVVLAQDEGIVMKGSVPATGTWQFGVSCCWAEVDTF